MNVKTPPSENRRDIALQMLKRYTGSSSKEFHSFVLLTNFNYYFDLFVKQKNVSVTHGSIMDVAHDPDRKISMVNFRMGAPTAALVIDILSYVQPKTVLMLGMCGGLHPQVKKGEFILPMAAIRNEGTSEFYMPKRVPALPTFKIQMILSEVLSKWNVKFKTGVIHSTDYRFWEFDQKFKISLKDEKAMGIEMECSTLFIAGFKKKIPIGALLLVSDLPLKKKGIKTLQSSKEVFSTYAQKHLDIGIETLIKIQALKPEMDLRHFEW